MDTKRMIIWTTAAMAVILGWMAITNYVERHWPSVEPQAAPIASDTQPATSPAATQFAAAPGDTQPTSGPAMAVLTSAPTAPAGPPRLAVVAATRPAEAAMLGSAAAHDKTYAMQLNVAPEGAAIGSVTLNDFNDPRDFKLTPDKRRPYVFQQADPTLPNSQSLATRSVAVNGQTVDLVGVAWTREPGGADPNAVTYSVTLANGGAPLVKLTKTFVLPTRADPSQGYEVRVTHGVENLTDNPVTVKAILNGPTLPPPEQSRPPDRQVVAGYKVDTKSLELGQHPIEGFKRDAPTIDLTNKDGHAMQWAGTESTYFAAFVFPAAPAADGAAPPQAAVPAGLIANVTATERGAGNDQVPSESRAVTMTFDLAEAKLAARQSASLPMHVFLGPRWRSVLESPHYSDFPRAYNATLVAGGTYCGLPCTFGWLITAMVKMLGAFHWVAGGWFRGDNSNGSWGIAIIMLVCIVRTCLHPIMKRSQVQMMKMGKMGPEMEKLKKKYGDDKDALNKAMMQFYKEQGAAPILGCLPMFLQMPIWIALYSALQTTFELRQAPFLWNLTWIHDLSKPDYLKQFDGPVSLLFGWHVEGINLLPILMAGVFWLQQKFTPKPPATTPEQQTQQKMMQWMSLLFPVFLYNGPSGLNLYILTSTTIGIFEAKIIRDHIKAREAAEKSERVIIDVKPTRGNRRGKDDRAEPPEKPGLLARLAAWWGEIQSKVDQERSKKGR